MNIMHSSRNDSWGTPPEILYLVQRVLVKIDLDPASDTCANQRVGAKRIITRDEDGLTSPWSLDLRTPQTIFLNPPGGKLKNKSLAALFWGKLVEMEEQGLLNHAIFIGFSTEIAQTSQRYSKSVLDFPICVPRQRLNFVDSYGFPGKAHSHSNIIVYVPGIVDNRREFYETFKHIGACR